MYEEEEELVVVVVVVLLMAGVHMWKLPEIAKFPLKKHIFGPFKAPGLVNLHDIACQGQLDSNKVVHRQKDIIGV